MYGGDTLKIVRPANRQISLPNKPAMSSLYADLICAAYDFEGRHVAEKTVVLDAGFVMLVGVGSDSARKLNPMRLDDGKKRMETYYAYSTKFT